MHVSNSNDAGSAVRVSVVLFYFAALFTYSSPKDDATELLCNSTVLFFSLVILLDTGGALKSFVTLIVFIIFVTTAARFKPSILNQCHFPIWFLIMGSVRDFCVNTKIDGSCVMGFLGNVFGFAVREV